LFEYTIDFTIYKLIKVINELVEVLTKN
jgi:hypothetical protein